MHQERNTAIIVGLVVTLTTALLVSVIAILSKWNVSTEGFVLNVKYHFLNDLLPGAPVKLAGGIKVGFVREIRQQGVETIVELFMDHGLRGKIPNSPKTQFAIFTTGMMGQKYINLSVPAADENFSGEYYSEGDTLRGTDPPSIDQIMLSFSSWFDGKNGGQVLAEVIKETKDFVAGLNGLLNENREDIHETIKLARVSFTKLSAQMDELMSRLTVISGDFQEISNKNKEDINIMLKNLSAISYDFNVISQRIQTGQGSLGKFVYSDEFYKNLNDASKHASALFQKLRDEPYLLLYKKN